MVTIIAGLVVLDVVAVYVYCLRLQGVYPPTQPWSGLALVFLSGSMVLGERNLNRLSPTLSLQVMVGALLLSAGLWTYAALKP